MLQAHSRLYIWLYHQPLKEGHIIYDHHLYCPCQHHRPALKIHSQHFLVQLPFFFYERSQSSQLLSAAKTQSAIHGNLAKVKLI